MRLRSLIIAAGVAVAVAVGLGGGLVSAQAPVTVPPGTWSVQYLLDNSQTVGGYPQTSNPRNNRGLALSPDGRYIYAGYNNGGSTPHQKQIRKIDLLQPDYTLATVKILQGYRGKAIATDDVGRVYLADSSSITVWDANLSALQLTITTATTPGATVSAAEGVAVTREGGGLALYSSDRGTGFLTKRWLTESGPAVNGATLVWTVSLALASAELRGVEVDPVTGNVWVAGIVNNTVYVVNPSGGSVGTVLVHMPIDIAFDGRTALVTREYDLLISRFDADTLLSAGADLAPPLAGLKLTATAGEPGAVDGIVVASPGVYYVAGNGINTAGNKSTYGRIDGWNGYVSGEFYRDNAGDDNDPILKYGLPTTEVISNVDLGGWNFFEEDVNPAIPMVLLPSTFVLGPSTPPLPTGSAHLVEPTFTKGMGLGAPLYAGVGLWNIHKLSYSTYVDLASSTGGQAPALQFPIDFNLFDTSESYQGRLVFEPDTSAVVKGMWQDWDALAGKWWANGVSSGECSQAQPCAWQRFLQLFPSAGIHRLYGGILFKVGSGWAPIDANVDNLTVAIGGDQTTFNFELETLDQTITFGLLAGKTYGNAPFAVSATSDSGLAVTFSASGQCSVTPSGSEVTLTSAGDCTIHANQAGNDNYNPADTVNQTFSISKADATVVVTPYTVTYDGLPHTATVTSITGVNGETGATVGTVTLNTTHTNVGAYSTDSWSFAGAANYSDIAGTTITDTISDTTVPGDMHGNGFVTVDTVKYQFDFQVSEDAKKKPNNRFELRVDYDPKSKHENYKFVSTTINPIIFSDGGFEGPKKNDPLIDTVVFSGTVVLKGDKKTSTTCNFTVNATDQGEPGKKVGELFGVIITGGTGCAVDVHVTALSGGNIQSKRVKH